MYFFHCNRKSSARQVLAKFIRLHYYKILNGDALTINGGNAMIDKVMRIMQDICSYRV
ncbi:hypothetical protein MITSMUL_04864 [Mitsuokella multacida DSM 20544]|uniref:Uncharacterized protein n=1 Tax=Mitsuokella multacida DSM 20544 TaxID=500635 RepID=C9KNR2_9FIRM|nr:hypothetical protein MITSMUL_04864 [Mitsuokella multacida DSM 20544]